MGIIAGIVEALREQQGKNSRATPETVIALAVRKERERQQAKKKANTEGGDHAERTGYKDFREIPGN